jgi:hypothetical protein
MVIHRIMLLNPVHPESDAHENKLSGLWRNVKDKKHFESRHRLPSNAYLDPHHYMRHSSSTSGTDSGL